MFGIKRYVSKLSIIYKDCQCTLTLLISIHYYMLITQVIFPHNFSIFKISPLEFHGKFHLAVIHRILFSNMLFILFVLLFIIRSNVVLTILGESQVRQVKEKKIINCCNGFLAEKLTK